jgi:hypothetical protein
MDVVLEKYGYCNGSRLVIERYFDLPWALRIFESTNPGTQGYTYLDVAINSISTSSAHRIQWSLNNKTLQRYSSRKFTMRDSKYFSMSLLPLQ